MEVLNEEDLDAPLGNVTGFDDDIRTVGVRAVQVQLQHVTEELPDACWECRQPEPLDADSERSAAPQSEA